METYRPHIDGLRALAIIPVVIYHLKVPFGSGDLLPGGFLGVDVFFVISGYLITSILLREQADTGKISILRFYQRRARRILPALFLVIFASLSVGWFVLLPTELERLATSTLAALAFVSNVYWFFELGEYGAQSGLLQPMLHTWSLAIEEQFYLVFPVLLLLLKPATSARRGLFVVLALLLVSLVISQVTTHSEPELSFFSPVSRAWEMLVGTLLALVAFHWPERLRVSPRLGWWAPKLAVLTLGLSVWFVVLSDVNHPGLVTLPTVLATGALICFAEPNEHVTRFLSWRPTVFIGKLSYSLYLWHFPVFAFGRLLNMGEPNAWTIVTWLGLTVVLSLASYYLVERPLRLRISGRMSVFALGTSLAVCVGSVLFIAKTDLSSRDRMEEFAEAYGANEIDNEVLLLQSWEVLDDLAGPNETISREHARSASPYEREHLWFEPDARINLLIIGDSHSKDLFNAFYLSDAVQRDFGIARFGIAADFPEEQLEQLYASPNFEEADWILISNQYGRNFETDLPRVIEALTLRGRQVALVGHTPEFDWPGTLPIFDWFVRTHGSADEFDEINSIGWNALSQHVEATNTQLQLIAGRAEIPFLSRHDLVCDASIESCVIATPDGMKTMYDRGHWTLEGARLFGDRAAEIGWLDPLYPRVTN